jgi:hypothetical protein
LEKIEAYIRGENATIQLGSEFHREDTEDMSTYQADMNYTRSYRNSTSRDPSLLMSATMASVGAIRGRHNEDDMDESTYSDEPEVGVDRELFAD